MRWVFSTVAQRELLAALHYYENQRLGLGAELLDELDKALDFIRRYPEGSPTTGRNIRQRPLRRFPFVLFYAIRRNDMVVLSVAHTHRKPRRWETM